MSRSLPTSKVSIFRIHYIRLYKSLQNGAFARLRTRTNKSSGSFTTPSFVSFTDKERLIGESAKNQAAMNPRNTIFDIKSVHPPLLLGGYVLT